MPIRPAPLGLFLALALLVVLPAREATAHGGQYRAPGRPPPSGPGVGPSPVPQVITPGETWQTWWDLNRLNLLPSRHDMLRTDSVTPASGERGEAVDPYRGWEQRRLVAARERVLPFLFRLLDPKAKTRDEVRAAALIALGKTSVNGAARTLAVRYLHDPKSSTLVRESAALAIGLLCRSRPEHQLEARLLDELRGELLRAIDDEDAGLRVRAFAALSLGLLGDQPTRRDGEEGCALIVPELWRRLLAAPKGLDLPVALITAIGLQPRETVPLSVLDGLRNMATGKRVPGRRWTPFERSHAVTALARLGPPGVDALLIEVAGKARTKYQIRRAVYLGAARRAGRVNGPTRVRLARAVAEALEKRRDPLTFGLGLIAAGRLLGADLAVSRIEVLQATKIPKLLFTSAEKGQTGERGFATLAIALAAQGARASGAALPFLAKSKAMMLNGLEAGRGDDTIRAAYAVGLGLLEAEEGVEPLLAVVRDRGALPVLRGHAAVALGQIGRNKDEVRSVLREILDDKRDVLLRMRGALALALLGDRQICGLLLDELEGAKSEHHRSHIVIGLGRLGDLSAVQRLMAYVRNEDNSELARALGVVALGLIVDPEPRPSLTKLRQDANFPSATQVLYSAFAIF